MYTETRSFHGNDPLSTSVDLLNVERSRSPRQQLNEILPNTGSYNTNSIKRTASPIKRIADYSSRLNLSTSRVIPNISISPKLSEGTYSKDLSLSPQMKSHLSQSFTRKSTENGIYNENEILLNSKNIKKEDSVTEVNGNVDDIKIDELHITQRIKGADNIDENNDKCYFSKIKEDSLRKSEISDNTHSGKITMKDIIGKNSIVHSQGKQTVESKYVDEDATPHILVSEMLDKRYESSISESVVDEKISKSQEMLEGKFKKIEDEFEGLKKEVRESRKADLQGLRNSFNRDEIGNKNYNVSWREINTKIQQAKTSRVDEAFPSSGNLNINNSTNPPTAAQMAELTNNILADNKKLKYENTMLKVELQRCEYNEETIKALKCEIERLTKLVKIRERDLATLREKYISALRGGSRYRSECSIDDHFINCDL